MLITKQLLFIEKKLILLLKRHFASDDLSIVMPYLQTGNNEKGLHFVYQLLCDVQTGRGYSPPRIMSTCARIVALPRAFQNWEGIIYSDGTLLEFVAEQKNDASPNIEQLARLKSIHSQNHLK